MSLGRVAGEQAAHGASCRADRRVPDAARGRRRRSTWPATTTSAWPRTRDVAAAAAEAARHLGRRRRRVAAGHRHAELHAELERELAAFTRPAGGARVLDRLPRQPRRGHRAGRPRLPGRLRRPRARLARRRRRLAGRRRVVPHNDVAAVSARRWRQPPAGARWCSSSRSTPCSATPHRSPSSPVCAAYDATAGRRRGPRLGVAGTAGVGPGARARAGRLPHVVVTDDALEGARRQGGAVLGSPASSSTWSTGRGRSSTTPASRPAAAAAALEALRTCWRRARAARLVHGVRADARRRGSASRSRRRRAVGADAIAAGGARRRRPRPGGGRAVGCFRPPSVPDGISRLRITDSAGIPTPTGRGRPPGGQGAAADTVSRSSSSPAPTPASARPSPRPRSPYGPRDAGRVVVKPVQTGIGPEPSADDDEVVPRSPGVRRPGVHRLEDPLAPDTPPGCARGHPRRSSEHADRDGAGGRTTW
jgi:8-amino-7-oxononanoate synthase